MLSLPDLQQQFFEALTPGAGPRADARLLAVVRGRGALDPAARVAIYADMYRARLLDVLREDFPRTLAVLGERFDALAEGYLVRHPSRHPSLRHLGHAFADDLAGAADVPPFAADLARLEWARADVFDAPDPEPLRLADLATLAPEDWPALRLALIPACRLVRAAWPVHEIWAAAGEDPPGAAAHEPAPAATTVRVWREGWSVSHAAMGPLEVAALGAVARGESFAQVCAAAGAGGPAEAAAREVGALLMRWLEDGLLARPDGAPR